MQELIALLVILGLVVLVLPAILALTAMIQAASLKRRVAHLEADVAALRHALQARAASRASTAPGQAPAPPSTTAAPVTPVAPPATPPVQATRPTPSVSAIPAPARTPDPVHARATGTTANDAPGYAPPPQEPDRITLFARAIKRWFTTGNVPVKIGVLVLLAGIGALLRYASDQGWLRMPIELRLAGIAAGAVGGLVFAWRKRESHRTFALSVQGGMIGVLLMTVFAAMKVGVLPSLPAFVLSVILVAGAGALAVLQNARALAVFALLAGFLAPIWLSDGSGNHVGLFGYYALLNAAILGVAWFKAWRVLNLLGFAFTFGIGTFWGVLAYRPEDFAGTQPFLALFFVFYLAIPLLYARRRPAGKRDLIDGCLVFGTPLVAFLLQAGLLDGDRLVLAFVAVGVAALYLGLAWFGLRRANLLALGQSYAVLAVGFATLAVPLAFSGQVTASVFALEGAALVWLGLRQQRLLPQIAGTALQSIAAFAYLVSVPWSAAFPHTLIANPLFIGALLLALAGLASAWFHHVRGLSKRALPWYLWGLLWWCVAVFGEILRSMPQQPGANGEYATPLILLALGVTGWLAAWANRVRPAAALALTTLAGFLLAIGLAVLQAGEALDLASPRLLIAWLVYAAIGVHGLILLRGAPGRIAVAAQFIWWLLWPTLIALLLQQSAARFGLAHGWTLTATALPWLALLAISLLRWPWLQRPLGERFDLARIPLQGAVVSLLGLWWLGALLRPGSAAPLPWLPIVNPLDLAQIGLLVLVARWLATPALDRLTLRTPLLAASGFVLISVITLRGAHHLGGIGWTGELLSSSLSQTSLTIVWSVLGVLGWIIGSRRGRRGLWLAGALLMAVVLAKLVLVDRGHLGNLWGIGSFIAYGLLCTVVGFFAPAPPRTPSERTPSEHEVSA